MIVDLHLLNQLQPDMTHDLYHHRIKVTVVDTMNSLQSPEVASTMRIPTLKAMIINTFLHQTIQDLHQATIKA